MVSQSQPVGTRAHRRGPFGLARHLPGRRLAQLWKRDGATARKPIAGGKAQPHEAFEHHHRNVQGGAARAAVFGISDGLVTNVSLILGVAGAQPGPSYVRLAGISGLLAGAFSMAAGEFVSVSAQKELLARELDVEREALDAAPEAEREELAALYEQRGLPADLAAFLAGHMMKTPEMALEAHAREELGIDPRSMGSPLLVAVSSLVSFAVGAAVPLVPWLFTSGNAGIVGSVALAALAAVGIGLALSQATGRSRLRSVFRQLAVSMLAAGVTYLIGRFVGVSVGH
ncbi:MAG: VIT1/CCC1 transporter family protein [Acidimicrobiales bacterium]